MQRKSNRIDGVKWRRLPLSADTADLQLAAGEALLSNMAASAHMPIHPALRWYTMRNRALILGSSQRLSEFDLSACRAAGISLYRRSSGGTAVLSEPDQIMQDIALPDGHTLYSHDVTASYRWLGEIWASVLARLGVQAHVITIEEARADRQALDDLTRRACYGGRSPYEVLVDGRKVIGLAQVRRRYGALLQTGIYTHWHPERLAELLAMPDHERSAFTARLKARVAGLADLPPAPTNPSGVRYELPDLMRHFADVLRETHGITLVDAAWEAAELEARTQAIGRFAALEI